MTPSNRAGKVFWTLVTAAVFSLLMSIVVGAHEAPSGKWRYPNSCCSEHDCAPAKVGEKDGRMTLTNKFGTVVVPEGFKWNSSGDEEFHACIICGYGEMSTDASAYCTLLCAFAPAGG